MINYILACLILGFFVVYIVVELGWGGSRRGEDGAKAGDRIKLPRWYYWRRIGLYPPEPPDRGPSPVKPIKPKTPENVSG